MSRLFKTLGFLSLFLTGAALAASAPHETLRQASEQLFSEVRTAHKQLQGNPAQIYTLVDNSLGPYVDFPLVAQLVLGKHWRTATEQQRARFTAEFHQMLVRFYAGAFVDDPHKLDVLLVDAATLLRFEPAQLNPDGVRATVNANVHLPNGQVVPVAFALHHKGPVWKVYDVTVEGISLITNYRTSFSSEIQRGGLDGLIERLAVRNRELLARAR